MGEVKIEPAKCVSQQRHINIYSTNLQRQPNFLEDAQELVIILKKYVCE